ncbi:hypothetical protein LWI28_007292 [Acer negundo]|uniref:Uncharacterized protein n=1 Tax=Acer negundo TaxID=4023 RepID=A0AAD5NWP1_ACENE|nr:hypothetical protein LWI28_007292 [Acer negundo]
MFALIMLEDRRFLDVMYVITNVDAALDVGGGRVGVGSVVRNDSVVPIFAAGVCLIGGADLDKIFPLELGHGLKRHIGESAAQGMLLT